jgi:hypothetical protein
MTSMRGAWPSVVREGGASLREGYTRLRRKLVILSTNAVVAVDDDGHWDHVSESPPRAV